MNTTRQTRINADFLKISVIVLIMLFCNLSRSQTRAPQETRKVTVTSQCMIKEGTKTNHCFVTYQEMYDSLGRLHTEIEWDLIDHQPHNYKWHSYSNDLKTKTEIFRNEKLFEVIKYTYGNDKSLVKEEQKYVNQGDTIFVDLDYKYNNPKRIRFIEVKAKTKRLSYTAKIEYDERGNEILYKVKTKNGLFPLDSIISRETNLAYDSVGRVKGYSETTEKVGKQKRVINYSIKYDSKNNIIEKQEKDKKGLPLRKTEFLYQISKNRIIYIKKYDSNNKLIEYQEKRYEIYPTRDHKMRVIDY